MTNHVQNAEDLTFGCFRLDRRGALLRDGQRVQLRSRSAEILRVLAGAHGGLVTKDDLMARVWPGAVVEDNALQVHVSALRKALGEDLGGQRYIVTVPGRGYRFVAGPAGVGGPPLPDKPSIAVMPFQNMSGDPDQDYFADGVVEEIISAFTRFSSLFVIARNSSFVYKGRAFDAKQVSRDLGVRYLLEGSVRKSLDRMRITAQLIEAVTGAHVWAHRCEGDLADIFALQDEVAGSVVAAIVPRLEQAEVYRARRKSTASLDAYDYYLRGVASFHQLTKESVSNALTQLYKAIELDPEFASAHGMAAWCISQRRKSNWMTDPPAERAEARRLAERAALYGKDDALALCMAGNTLSWLFHDHDSGAALVDRALSLNPNLGIAWRNKAWSAVWLGNPDSAISAAGRVMRLSPIDPLFHDLECAVAFAHFAAGRNEEAAAWAERAWREKGPIFHNHRILAVSYVLTGRLDDAKNAIMELRRLKPDACISDAMDRSPFRRPEDRERFAEGLRVAGLPR